MPPDTTKEHANARALDYVRGLCRLQFMAAEGDSDQQQVGREALELAAEQLAMFGLLDELITIVARRQTSLPPVRD
jgi:hypothetical protein